MMYNCPHCHKRHHIESVIGQAHTFFIENKHMSHLDIRNYTDDRGIYQGSGYERLDGKPLNDNDKIVIHVLSKRLNNGKDYFPL